MLNKLPKPHINNSWPVDILEDYARAPDDETRRRILLAAGYDKAHRADALRLFPKLIHERKDEFQDIVDRVDADQKKDAPRASANLKEILILVAAIATIVGAVYAVLAFYH